MLVFRDVTDLRRKETALMAHEKLAVAGRLSASIAHEIHNPLDSVANLHYLMAKESDAALQQKYLAMAQQELNRTLQISRAMLGLYREPKAPVNVDLRELLESVLLLLDRQLKDQSVAVDRKLGAATSIQGFPGELRQVFTNLITNGAEASGRGGRVQILLEDSLAAAAEPGATVVISDSGPGIAAAHQAKLFKPFFTTKGELGTGLGLWVSRGIIEKHGWQDRVGEQHGPAFPGAAVRVYLPPLGPGLSHGRRRQLPHPTPSPDNALGALPVREEHFSCSALCIRHGFTSSGKLCSLFFEGYGLPRRSELQPLHKLLEIGSALATEGRFSIPPATFSAASLVGPLPALALQAGKKLSLFWFCIRARL